ncbi:MAG: antibiotic biosynthesis monooxygenase [Chloroflexi bacterium]|nr:antibiotic biosynthesis monooxygenase [Chloroflexota bacterium]
METGNVAALFTVQGKLPTQAEWEAALDANWDDAVEELRSNPGFKGIVALWNSDDSGEVAIIGLWENMERRLAYEARSAEKVRALFDPLFQSVPNRPRFIVSRSSLF